MKTTSSTLVALMIATDDAQRAYADVMSKSTVTMEQAMAARAVFRAADQAERQQAEAEGLSLYEWRN